MVSNDAIIIFRSIIILDKVVPCMPFPNNVRLIVFQWLDFDNEIRPHIGVTAWCIACYGGVSSRLESLFLCLVFPCDGENVSVWHRFDIVVCDVRRRGKLPRPFRSSIPSNPFNFTCSSTAAEVAYRLLRDICAP